MLHDTSAGALADLDQRVGAVRHLHVFELPREQLGIKRLRFLDVLGVELYVYEWIGHGWSPVVDGARAGRSCALRKWIALCAWAQLRELALEKPLLGLRARELQRAREARQSLLLAPERAQKFAARGRQERIALQALIERHTLQRREAGRRALRLAECDRAIQCDHWRRLQVIK